MAFKILVCFTRVVPQIDGIGLPQPRTATPVFSVKTVQGAGKTNAAAKPVRYCPSEDRYVQLVASDGYRPAAIKHSHGWADIKHLQTLAESIDVDLFEMVTYVNVRNSL